MPQKVPLWLMSAIDSVLEPQRLKPRDSQEGMVFCKQLQLDEGSSRKSYLNG